MKTLDWLVLIGTTAFIVLYGIWKSRKQKGVDGFLLSGNSLPWFTISLSIIATQASAVTFLSVPGQAYTDGMRFVLFYLGLPLAMIVVSATMVPIYYKLHVYTAYEYLETRFNVQVRTVVAFLFLIQRSLSAGISIAAPVIILSAMFGWDVFWGNLISGLVIVLYTVTGGSEAVSQTQKLQMGVILIGMALAGVWIVAGLPPDVSLYDAVRFAGINDKLNTMDFKFDLDNRYNLWSGLIGGFFLQMAYFGTDQSQVGRYLGGKSIAQSRLALLFNGIFKIPMQFSILFIGAMLFVFYQFQQPPILFNPSSIEKLRNSELKQDFSSIESQYNQAFALQQAQAKTLMAAQQNGTATASQKAQYDQTVKQTQAYRQQAQDLLKKQDPTANTNDTNYIFLDYITRYLPAGMVGLLIVVIFAASMSTASSELNALSTTTLIDIYKRSFKPDASDDHYIWVSKGLTLFWGIMSIFFAQLAGRLGTLIEAVNILGSLFYGTILGIFLLAFYVRYVKTQAAFAAVFVGQGIIFFLFFYANIAYLWLNFVGCAVVVLSALTWQWGSGLFKK
ncbi:MAG TPA: sodium:solute symporter [Microscillaceae bacterium]|jgi:Na+/proline symporter|nr:sodium:solute symporter [Microscillaceae bacterium]